MKKEEIKVLLTVAREALNHALELNDNYGNEDNESLIRELGIVISGCTRVMVGIGNQE